MLLLHVASESVEEAFFTRVSFYLSSIFTPASDIPSVLPFYTLAPRSAMPLARSFNFAISFLKLEGRTVGPARLGWNSLIGTRKPIL